MTMAATWLWPRSNHPEHQQPIEVPAANVEEYDAEGGDEIEVTAIVVADYRIRQRRKRQTEEETAPSSQPWRSWL